MSVLSQVSHTIAPTATFFAVVYLAYLCMYLAPTGHLRRWGATTLGLLILLGPARRGGVIRIDGTADLRGYRLTPASGSRRR